MQKLSQVNVDHMLIRHYVWLKYTGLTTDKGEVADFSGCDVSGLDFSHADLKCASFKSAVCVGTNFSHTSLYKTTFERANLEGANFKGALLVKVDGDDNFIKNIKLPVYHIAYTKDRLQIGCQDHSILEWTTFSDSEIAAMDTDKDAVTWWNEYKEHILNTIKNNPAK